MSDRSPELVDLSSHRFSGVGRLYGDAALDRFASATVAVVGVGGVGSWVAEALTRSGVGSGSGRLVLMDLDDVCVTNTNRQVQAVAEAVGRPKVEALAERMHAIAPENSVQAVSAFFGPNTAEALWATRPDVVVDAVDRAGTKALLIAQARERGVPIVTVGGAGGRVDPGAARTCDVTRAYDDSLLAATRKRLRQLYGFERNPRKKWGVPCVFSPEPPREPDPGEAGADGPKRLDCATGYGSSVVVTGTFAFHATAVVLGLLREHGGAS
ncbi:MAG: tRNA threonylcarbamoyladenosine dehydratase [Planctomycetota bacterium]